VRRGQPEGCQPARAAEPDSGTAMSGEADATMCAYRGAFNHTRVVQPTAYVDAVAATPGGRVDGRPAVPHSSQKGTSLHVQHSRPDADRCHRKAPCGSAAGHDDALREPLLDQPTPADSGQPPGSPFLMTAGSAPITRLASQHRAGGLYSGARSLAEVWCQDIRRSRQQRMARRTG